MSEGQPTLEELRARLHGKISAKRQVRKNKSHVDVDDVEALIQRNFQNGQSSSVSSTMVASLLKLMGKLRDGVTSQNEAAGIVRELQDVLQDLPKSQRNGIASMLEQVSGGNEGLRQLMQQLVPNRGEDDVAATQPSSSNGESNASTKKKKKIKKKKKKKPKSAETNEPVVMARDGSRPAFCM
jgi:hypothetical protein